LFLRFLRPLGMDCLLNPTDSITSLL
jgi:hypothetical protein